MSRTRAPRERSLTGYPGVPDRLQSRPRYAAPPCTCYCRIQVSEDEHARAPGNIGARELAAGDARVDRRVILDRSVDREIGPPLVDDRGRLADLIDTNTTARLYESIATRGSIPN